MGTRYWGHGIGGMILGALYQALYWGTVSGARYWGHGTGGTVLGA